MTDIIISKYSNLYLELLAAAKTKKIVFRSTFVLLSGDVAVYENEDFLNKFDRIISIEMFEHMKNYGALLKKISGLEF